MLVDRAQLRVPAAAAHGLLLPLVRGRALRERALDRSLRRAEPRGGDEQPAARRPRQRRRDEPDLPELRAGALDRHLLHADDHRALDDAATDAQRRARGARRGGGDRAPHRRPSAGLDPVRGVPRLQPDRAPARPARARPPQRPGSRRPDGQGVLPAPDLRAVPVGAARGVLVRDRRLPDRGRGIRSARRQVRPRGAAGRGRAAERSVVRRRSARRRRRRRRSGSA